MRVCQELAQSQRFFSQISEGLRVRTWFLQHCHKVYAEVNLAVMCGCILLCIAFSFILREELSIPK